MPHTPLTRKQGFGCGGPGRLGKPGTPAKGFACFRLPAWRQFGEMAPVMAGISTTILLGIAALRELFCPIPFASGSPHVPGLEFAILVLAAAYLWTASVPTGDAGASMGQNGFPIYSTLRTSLTHSMFARSRASSLQFTGD
jgi:hypothetical protein